MDKLQSNLKDWQNSKASIFWGEIAPCDHVVQIYDNDDTFLSTLEEFACTGLHAGDSVILIATDVHLSAIHERMQQRGLQVDPLKRSDRYIALNATETLARFMVNDWPDERLFKECIDEIISRARKSSSRVRAFGEMVALLWAEGKNGATVQLEGLWNKLHSEDAFSLYCAYPKPGFTQSPHDSLHTICKAHSRVIDGSSRDRNFVYHRNS